MWHFGSKLEHGKSSIILGTIFNFEVMYHIGYYFQFCLLNMREFFWFFNGSMGFDPSHFKVGNFYYVQCLVVSYRLPICVKRAKDAFTLKNQEIAKSPGTNRTCLLVLSCGLNRDELEVPSTSCKV